MNSRVHVPNLQHHKASGRARVEVAGKQYYLGEWGAPETDQAYRRFLAELFANDGRVPTHHGGHVALSVAELMADYWSYVERHYVKNGKPTSEQAAIRAALRPVLDLYGDVDVAAFGPQALIACREKMVEKGWKRYTVNKAVGRVRRMFAWGAERERVPGSVYHALTSVRSLQRARTRAPESKRVLPVEQAHIDAVRAHVSAQVATMIDLQLITGMRPGEVVLMRPCDVTTEEPIWTYTPEHHKTEHHGHDRMIPLGPRAQAILAPYLENRAPTVYLFDPREAEKARRARQRLARKSKVTPSQANRKPRKHPKRAPKERYSTPSYRRAIRRACEKAEVPVWQPHRLRHNAATAIQRAYGMEASRVVLGHQSPAVTEVYVERDQGLARRVAGEIG
ncbi:MAG: site-specific integrase [Planctomycetota bacterium]